MIKRFAKASCLLVAALGIAASAYGQQPAKKLVYALNWSATEHHAAYWVALDKGYYKHAGLDPEFQYSKGSGDAIAKVDTGRAEFGLADATTVITAISRGAKVKIIGMVFDKSPLNFFAWKDGPIRAPKDLEGKTIAAPPGDAQRTFFPAFAKIVGIDAGKVKWVNVEPSAKVAIIVGKRVDAVAEFLTSRPLYDKAMGRANVAMIPWSKFGFDMYSLAIIASDKTVKDNPLVARSFLEASYKGWRDVIADPSNAVQIFKRRVPEIDATLIEAGLRLVTELVNTDQYKRNGIGSIDERKMCQSVDFVNTYMDLPRKVECRDAYTAQLIPMVNVSAAK